MIVVVGVVVGAALCGVALWLTFGYKPPLNHGQVSQRWLDDQKGGGRR
jgi:hypothetical protein